LKSPRPSFEKGVLGGVFYRLRPSFTLHHKEGLRRFAHDFHGLLGLVSALILLLLAFTGFHLAFPKIIETLAGASGMGHGEDGPAIRSTAAHNNRPVSLAEAVVIARGLFPHAEIRRVATPAGEDGTYRVNLRRPGEVNIRHPVTLVWIDRWSGQIRDVRNPNKFTPGQTLVSSLWPLHTGEYFGPLGRLSWFFAGLTPLLFYITGLVQWLIKRGVMEDRKLDWSGLHSLWINADEAMRRQLPLMMKLLKHWGLWAWTQVRRWVEKLAKDM